MVLIYVSLSEDSQASELAEQLINERLANHINIIRNNECLMYTEGRVQKTFQTILLIKTRAILYKQIEESIQSRHISPPPKIFSVPMTQVDGDYHTYLTQGIIG